MLRLTLSSKYHLPSVAKPRGPSLRYQTASRGNVSRWTPQTQLRIASVRSNTLSKSPRYDLLANFHTTPPRQNPLFYGLLASVLKASASIEFARMITKVALTFVPFFVIKNMFARKYLKHVVKNSPELEHKRDMLEKKVRTYTLSYRTLIAIPIAIFGLTLLASLERTPLSGRWRVIPLSPEEEGQILEQLQGDGWYRAVLEVISQDGPPDIIPPSDWRYQIVESVLRRLERTIPILAAEKRIALPWPDRAPDDVPFPPPAKHPLKPRPAAKEYLRWFCDSMCPEPQERKRVQQPSHLSTREPDVDSPHLVPGPPYNLIVIDRPGCDNAFSFGFGPNGGGGIVVYSGFLDRVFGKDGNGMIYSTTFEAQVPPSSRSMFSELMGSLLAFSSSPYSSSPARAQQSSAPPCTPTEEQITQLAILLSHELSHLILSHHLETLSAGTVFIPGAVSMLSDVLRAVLFPVTMIFGPFVNDAVANLGKVGTGEFAKLSEYCTSMGLEFEADAVSARILAHAGFDARQTVSFWERRRDALLSECSPARAAENARDLEESLVVSMLEDGGNKSLPVRLARRIVGATHPSHEARLLRLKSELQRWETERMRALRKKAKKQKKKAKKQKKEAKKKEMDR